MEKKVKLEGVITDSGKKLYEALRLLEQFKTVEMEAEKSIVQIELPLLPFSNEIEIMVFQNSSPWFSPLGQLVFNKLVELSDEWGVYPALEEEIVENPLLEDLSTKVTFSFLGVTEISPSRTKLSNDFYKIKLEKLLTNLTVK